MVTFKEHLMLEGAVEIIQLAADFHFLRRN